MAKTYTYTEAQINLISEALNDADSFYDCFDDDNDGRGEIIRRGLEALSQSDGPCSHDGEHQESPRPTVNYYGQEIESDYVPHMCEHDGEHCDGAEFCETCKVQIFSGYVYGHERYCNDHKPATWDAEIAAMTQEEFDWQDGGMYWTQWEIDDIQCECVCPCRPSAEALQALYDADRAREGVA